MQCAAAGIPGAHGEGQRVGGRYYPAHPHTVVAGGEREPEACIAAQPAAACGQCGGQGVRRGGGCSQPGVTRRGLRDGKGCSQAAPGRQQRAAGSAPTLQQGSSGSRGCKRISRARGKAGDLRERRCVALAPEQRRALIARPGQERIAVIQPGGPCVGIGARAGKDDSAIAITLPAPGGQQSDRRIGNGRVGFGIGERYEVETQRRRCGQQRARRQCSARPGAWRIEHTPIGV